MRKIHLNLILIFILFYGSSVLAQQPPNCASGGTVLAVDSTVWYCTGLATAPVQITIGSGGSIPTGLITLIISGTCPTGFEEATELNGKTLVGTLAANGDVGTTGGNDNITPAGTNGSLTFTGTQTNTSAITAGTPSGTNSALTFTGTPFTAVINHTHAVTSVGSAATGSTTNLTGASDTSSTTATAANPAGGVSSITPAGTINTPVFTGNALGTHQHTNTATGTINTPSFTGTQFDNRSAFIKVIFCRKT